METAIIILATLAFVGGDLADDGFMGPTLTIGRVRCTASRWTLPDV